MIEEKHWSAGSRYIVGVDEVGRGAAAGPVMVAAVLLPVGCTIEGVKDSKKLTAKRREALKPVIEETAVAWSVKERSPKEIDEINILQATLQAMREAVEEIAQNYPVDVVLVDGDRGIPGLKCKQFTLVDGEERSLTIAAASIIAKVTRDALMDTLCEKEGGKYRWTKNKGYLTKEHQERILEHGPSVHHRMSFLKKLFAAS